MIRKNILALISIVLFTVAGVVASAQTTPASTQGTEAPQGRGRFGGRHGFSRPNLNLTDDQKAKLKAAHDSERQQIQAIRNDNSLSVADKMAKIRSIRENSRQQFLSVLTTDQQQQLHNLGKERRGFRGFRDAPFAGLNLTDAQKNQLKTMQANTRTQIEAIRNDASLSTDQKQAKIRSLMQSNHQQLFTIFTPEQQQQLQNRRGGFGRRGPFGRFGNGPNAPAAPKAPTSPQ